MKCGSALWTSSTLRLTWLRLPSFAERSAGCHIRDNGFSPSWQFSSLALGAGECTGSFCAYMHNFARERAAQYHAAASNPK